MKRMFGAVTALLLCLALPVDAHAARTLIPVGRIVGLQLRSDAVTIVAYDDALGSFARDAGLRIGDEIVKIGGKTVDSAEDVSTALGTEAVELTIRREGKLSKLQLLPKETAEGPRLGVYLRQGIAGIGTVTFYDPETGLFGTLGHGVSDSGGELLEMTGGTAWDAEVSAVKKGKTGDPGQLRGSTGPRTAIAGLIRNTAQGVFGITARGWPGEAFPTADYAAIRTGPAVIRCQVTGEAVQDYSAELLKIYPQSRPDGRNFLLKITDPALLQTTGGIVQGMSGSPIIQDGKLVGAVTHVLVNDPTKGYGIFIENMLEAAE